MPVALLVRDVGDSDDTVVGEDDDGGEISTNVDSSSSSAPTAAVVMVDAAVTTVAVVVVLAAVAAALDGSMLIFSFVLYSEPISIFRSRFVHSLWQISFALAGWLAHPAVFTSRSVFCWFQLSVASVSLRTRLRC